MAEELGLDTFATGVFVLGLERGSPAAHGQLTVRRGERVLTTTVQG